MTPDTSRLFAEARVDALRTAAWANRLKTEARRHQHNTRVLRERTQVHPSFGTLRPVPPAA